MSGAIRKLLALAMAAAFLHRAPVLRAEGAPVVEFSASEPDCPGPGFIDERFWQLVGESAESPGKAVVTLTKSDAAEYDFLIRITSGDQVGERRFSASSCRLGAATAALIIAISLFPERANDLEQRSQALSDQPPSNEPPPAQAPSAAVPTTKPGDDSERPAAIAPTRPAARSGAGPEIHPGVSLATGVDTTSMPAPAMGFAAVPSLQIDRVTLELSLAQFFSQMVDLPDQRSAQFSLMTFGGRACYSILEQPSFTLGPCLGATVVRQTGQGFGAERNFEQVAVYWGPAVGVALRRRIVEPLSVRIYAESFVSSAESRFVLEERLVHSPLAVGLSIFLGPELRF
jgi:hypothetical protein